MATSDSVGAQLSALRKTQTKVCANKECKKTFKGLAVTKFCSDECRFRHAYVKRTA